MVVVNDFLNFVRNLINGDSLNVMNFMAWGDDDTTPKTTDTTLGNQLLRKTCSSRSKIGLGELKYEGNVGTTELNGETIKELGIFETSGTGGIMMFRQLIDPIAKTSAFSLNFEITLRAKRV